MYKGSIPPHGISIFVSFPLSNFLWIHDNMSNSKHSYHHPHPHPPKKKIIKKSPRNINPPKKNTPPPPKKKKTKKNNNPKTHCAQNSNTALVRGINNNTHTAPHHLCKYEDLLKGWVSTVDVRESAPHPTPPHPTPPLPPPLHATPPHVEIEKRVKLLAYQSVNNSGGDQPPFPHPPSPPPPNPQ